MIRLPSLSSNPLAVAVLVSCIWLSAPVMCFAQPDEDEGAALKRANEQLKKLLESTEGVFYKEQDNANGEKYFVVVYEFKGDSSRIIMDVVNVGWYGDQYLHRVMMFASVVDNDAPLPPAAIKQLAVSGNQTLLGSGLTSNDFTDAYVKSDAILEGMTPGILWIHCNYLHANQKNLKEIIGQAMAGSN